MNRKIETELSQSLGRKVLVMTEYYPYFLVGTLEKVRSEEIWVNTKFGVSAPLKDKVFQIRIDAISAVFAENDKDKIPDVW